MANAEDNLICLNCGYDLRGTPGEVCSECGKGFSRDKDLQSRIPWERRVYGVWRFGMTLIAMSFWQGEIPDEVYRDHDPKRARRFARICWGIIAVALMGLFGASYFSVFQNPGVLFNVFGMRVQFHQWNFQGPRPVCDYTFWDYLPYDFFLLMGMALKGVVGIFVGCAALGMCVWDVMRIPGAVLSAGVDKEMKREKLASLGHYLAGLMCVMGLLTVMGMGVYTAIWASGDADPFNDRDLYSMKPLFIFTVIMPLPLQLFVFGMLISRIYQFRKRLFGKASVWGIAGRLMGVLSWRVLFWLVFIPCFVGFIRLVIDSLIWNG